MDKNLGKVTAYGIALKNGFVGTETEWLESLKGISSPNVVGRKLVGSDEDGEGSVKGLIPVGITLDDNEAVVDYSNEVTAFNTASGSDLELSNTMSAVEMFQNIQKQLDAKLKKSGGTMTGDLLLSTSAPTDPASASSKQFVENSISNALAGLIFKVDVLCASTANVNIASAPASIDGVTLANGNRVLLKDQTIGSQGGIYIYNGTGVAMTRALDADTGSELANKTVPVTSGTVNSDTWFKIINDSITIGSTVIIFSKVGGDGSYTQGDQISISGNAISVQQDSTHRFVTDSEKSTWNGKANVNSQAFTGTPSLPTGTTAVKQTIGNNTDAIATTSFVQEGLVNNDLWGGVQYVGLSAVFNYIYGYNSSTNKAYIVDKDVAIAEFSRYMNITLISSNTTLSIANSASYLRVTASCNITVPSNSTVAFPIKTRIDFLALNSVVATFVAASGVTINYKTNLLLTGYAACTLIKVGTNEWDLIGNN